jgi:iron(III) transport system permease protein
MKRGDMRPRGTADPRETGYGRLKQFAFVPEAAWQRGIKVLQSLPVIALIVLALSPIAITVVGSFKTSLPGQPAVWSLDGWVAAYTAASIWDAIANTFILSFMRVPISVVIGGLLAWLLIRTNLRGRKTVEFLFWVAFFLPTLPMAMAWALLLDPRSGWLNLLAGFWFGVTEPPFNIYSYLGITWVHVTTTTVPVMIILLGPAFRALDASMEESARMCGASRLTCLRRIVVPLMYPALMMATIAGFIRSLEAFEVELLLGLPADIRVYSTKIQELATWDPPRYAPAMALSVPFVVLLFLLALIYQRFLTGRSFTTVTGKASASPLIDLGCWRTLLSLVCAFIAGLMVIVPTATLLAGSFMEVFGITKADGTFVFTLAHWRGVLRDSTFVSSVVNTFVLGAGTALIGIILYSIIAYIILRSQVAGRKFLDLVVWLPWAFPGILLSLALLWIYLGTPMLGMLYGSMIGLIFAMLFKEMPMGVNLMKNGLLQISLELEEAATVCGARWSQTYRKVLLPLLGPTAVTVGMLAFIACVKDISTMILLATPETRPLSILVLDYTTNGSIEKGAVVGVISAAMAVGIALLGRKIGLGVGTSIGRA